MGRAPFVIAVIDGVDEEFRNSVARSLSAYKDVPFITAADGADVRIVPEMLRLKDYFPSLVVNGSLVTWMVNRGKFPVVDWERLYPLNITTFITLTDNFDVRPSNPMELYVDEEAYARSIKQVRFVRAAEHVGQQGYSTHTIPRGCQEADVVATRVWSHIKRLQRCELERLRREGEAMDDV